MWHMGRQCHPSLSPNGGVVSASANCCTGGRTRNNKGESVGFEMARALETNEIAGVVEDYRRCAELAKQVGFDGVKLSAGGGYLIDTFLQSVTNERTDQYSGSFENQTRFLFEVIDALKTVWPANRIVLRISLNGAFGGMGSADNLEILVYVLEQLSRSPVGHVAVQDGLGFGFTDKCRLTTAFDIKKAYKGRGAADFVGFGRAFMANPGLLERFLNDWPLNPDVEYKYWWEPTMGTEGYTDIPAYEPKPESA
uniref:NADH:flavin oxidoreductase/NADH oxidase N-terminal domain-containing protein n=1 Tax=Globisporangium ultimum (strain ATCC 200006 / CBS 805.95 / DAOM BR144) TaxID=431595 RepID=K3WR31_GLOUD